MIQSISKFMTQLKKYFGSKDDDPAKTPLDQLPDTLDIKEYLETLPNCTDADLI